LFTGIITDVGEVIGHEGGRFAIRSGYDADGIALGASIACDGCCLTVVTVRPDGHGSAFTVDVSNETLSKTTLGSWQLGRPVNLERALKAGDMYMRDGAGIMSSVLYGPDQRTKMTGATARVLFAVYAPPGVGGAGVRAHLDEIASNVRLVAPGAQVEVVEVLEA